MTVAEFIAELQQHNQEQEIIFMSTDSSEEYSFAWASQDEDGLVICIS